MRDLSNQEFSQVSGGIMSWFYSTPKPTTGLVVELSDENLMIACAAVAGLVAGTVLGVMAEKHANYYLQVSSKVQMTEE